MDINKLKCLNDKQMISHDANSHFKQRNCIVDATSESTLSKKLN